MERVIRKLIRVAGYFRPDVPLALGAILLLGLNLATGLLKPWPLALVVDHLLSGREWPGWLADFSKEVSRNVMLGWFCAVMLGLYAIQAAVAAAQNFLVIKIGLRGLARIRKDVFRWLQRLSLRFYHGNRQGDILYRASWDTYAVQTLFQQGFFGCLSAALSLVIMMVVMWRLDPRLTAVTVSTLPLLMLSMRFFGGKMSTYSLQAHQADSRVTSFVQQNITALALIQSFLRESHEERRFGGHVEQAFRTRLKQHGWEVMYLAIIGAIFGLGMAGIVWLGCGRVWAGRLSLGELLVFLAYLGQFYEPLNQLSRVGSTVADASAGVTRVLEVLDTPEEVADPVDGRPIIQADPAGRQGSEAPSDSLRGKAPPLPVVVRGAIEFERVSFGYKKERPVLRELSFRIRAGESVAIVGPSGAGKSTLLYLVSRFFDPDAGRLNLDGEDIRNLRLKDLRAQVAFLMQEPLLLPGSVGENIALADPEVCPRAMEEAARAAEADGFIRNLPEQYDTVVGDGAIRLSVGEKQRICLARAFLKNAPILLLDEPTNALDAESERLVLESLRGLMAGRTTLLVGHRPSTLRLAERVIVLENGQLTAEGRLDEVVKTNRFLDQLMAEAKKD